MRKALNGKGDYGAATLVPDGRRDGFGSATKLETLLARYARKGAKWRKVSW